MALADDEHWSNGFVVKGDEGDELLILTTSSVGASWQGGFLRDPDGRLVVAYG